MSGMVFERRNWMYLEERREEGEMMLGNCLPATYLTKQMREEGRERG